MVLVVFKVLNLRPLLDELPNKEQKKRKPLPRPKSSYHGSDEDKVVCVDTNAWIVHSVSCEFVLVPF